MDKGYNEITITEEQLGAIHHDPEKGCTVADRDSVMFINFPAIEKLRMRFSEPGLPLVLKPRFNAVLGYIDKEYACVGIDYPVDIKTTALAKVTISREEVEEFLKENPESDTLILSKTKDNIHGIRRYELAREILLDDESDSIEPGNLDDFDPIAHHFSKMVQ